MTDTAADAVYIDTESTSLREPHLPAGRRAWEWAGIRVSAAGEVLRAAWLQIRDVDVRDADPQSLRIGRYRQRFGTVPRPQRIPGGTLQRRDQTVAATCRMQVVTEVEAAKIIAGMTEGQPVIAGSNPSFDMANMADVLRRHNYAPDWYHHPRDVPNLVHGRLRTLYDLAASLVPEHRGLVPEAVRAEPSGWRNPTYSTAVLSEAAGLPVPADRHAAWDDAVWMLQLDRIVQGRPLFTADLPTIEEVRDAEWAAGIAAETIRAEILVGGTISTTRPNEGSTGTLHG